MLIDVMCDVDVLAVDDQAMVDNFKEAFACFDVAGHGVVTTEDLGRVMRAIGLEPSDDELKNMITEVDGSGKGAVDFKEFMDMMSKGGNSTASEIKETFSLFNKSQSGQISAGELKEIFNALGEKIADDEIGQMIKIADKSGNGGVTFKDLEQLMLE
jgi:Ca2+-binding EF-hand superfamily protein